MVRRRKKPDYFLQLFFWLQRSVGLGDSWHAIDPSCRFANPFPGLSRPSHRASKKKGRNGEINCRRKWGTEPAWNPITSLLAAQNAIRPRAMNRNSSESTFYLILNSILCIFFLRSGALFSFFFPSFSLISRRRVFGNLSDVESIKDLRCK